MLGYDGVSVLTRVMCSHGSFTESIFKLLKRCISVKDSIEIG